MIIDRINKFVYLACPRTASVSITRCLHNHFKSAVTFGFASHHRFSIPPEYKNFFIFCTVRNPYARILSHYRLRVGKQTGFEGWSFERYVSETISMNMKSYHKMNDMPCSSLPTGEYLTNFYKLEDIHSWWNGLPIWVSGAPDIPKRINISEARHGGKYTQETADAVYQFFKADFDKFSYEKESWAEM